MRATPFNQPCPPMRYRPRSTLLLHGKADRKGGFRVSHHAVGSDPGLHGPGGQVALGAGDPGDGPDAAEPSGLAVRGPTATAGHGPTGGVGHYPAAEGG